MNPDVPPASATGFWSIEKFVAFILGPAVTAGSGWLSTFLLKKWGIHLEGPEITGVFGAGALSAAGLAYKWLHGKQVEMKVTGYVAAAEHAASGIPGASGLIHTSLEHLEDVARTAAEQAVQQLTAKSGDQPPALDLEGGDPAPAGQADGAASGQ